MIYKYIIISKPWLLRYWREDGCLLLDILIPGHSLLSVMEMEQPILVAVGEFAVGFPFGTVRF